MTKLPDYLDLVALANHLPQLCWLADGAGSVYWYNERWLDYTGLPAASMVGTGWKQVHDPALADGVAERLTAAISTGQDWEDTFPLRRHDGVFRWFLSRAMPSRDSEGNIVCWIGTNTDVSETIEQEKEMLTKERRYRSLVDAVAQIVWRANQNAVLMGDTGPWQSFTGQTDAVIDGLGWLDAVHPEDREITMTTWSEAVAESPDV